jgi:HTH-type transcriptional regulator/antitoxin HigA
MDVRPIRTKRDYLAALKEAEALWDSRHGSKESDRLEVLTLLIQTYESEHYPIPDPDPIELLLHVMESRALTRKDLEPYIGSRARGRSTQSSAAIDARNDSPIVRRIGYSG